ncbi:MAG: PIN domain-containing protein [Haloarculaceae archaeon]
MILDTDFLIAIQTETEGGLELAAEIELQSVPKRIPSIVLQELYGGVGAGDDPTNNVSTYEGLVENEQIVPLNENIARRAGSLEGRHLVDEEKPNLGPADAIVAATGLVYNEPVVTSDDDFRHVRGLAVEPV